MPDGIAEDLVRSGFRRWSALEDEKQRIADDLKELAAEWKANGLNTKAMRAAFRRQRKMDEAADEVHQEEAEVELYLACLRVGTPRATPARRAEAAPEPVARATVELPAPLATGSVVTFADGMQAELRIVRPALPEEDIPEFLRRPKPASQPVPA